MDASLQAYGTAVYLQCVNSDGTTSSLLIAPTGANGSGTRLRADAAFDHCARTTHAGCNILFR